MTIVYFINVYDDGNERYNMYHNRWVILDSWKGKVSIMNKINQCIKIKSISYWKLTQIEH